MHREGSVSGWLSKPIKPRQLKSLLVDLLTPKDKELKSSEDQPPIQPEKISDLTILLAEDNPVNQKVALSMLSTSIIRLMWPATAWMSWRQ